MKKKGLEKLQTIFGPKMEHFFRVKFYFEIFFSKNLKECIIKKNHFFLNQNMHPSDPDEKKWKDRPKNGHPFLRPFFFKKMAKIDDFRGSAEKNQLIFFIY